MTVSVTTADKPVFSSQIIGTYVKRVPKKYRKTPAVIVVTPDENGEQLVKIRGQQFIIRVENPAGLEDRINGIIRGLWRSP